MTHTREMETMSERQMAVKWAREQRAWEIVTMWEMRIQERIERRDAERRAWVRRWWRSASRANEWMTRAG